MHLSFFNKMWITTLACSGESEIQCMKDTYQPEVVRQLQKLPLVNTWHSPNSICGSASLSCSSHGQFIFTKHLQQPTWVSLHLFLLSSPAPPLMPQGLILPCPHTAWKCCLCSFPRGQPLPTVRQKPVHKPCSFPSFSGQFWVTFWTLPRSLSRIQYSLPCTIDPNDTH